jgi:cysteine desulfurase
MYGGEHEGNRRPGTESVALAAGFAEALALAQKMKVKESSRVQKLRDAFVKMILKKIPGSTVNGDLEHALPNILNISIPDIESEALVIYLDAAGVAVSGKSACKSVNEEPSHVLTALYGEQKGERASIRFSLGRDTKKQDLDYVIKVLPSILEKISKK